MMHFEMVHMCFMYRHWVGDNLLSFLVIVECGIVSKEGGSRLAGLRREEGRVTWAS